MLRTRDLILFIGLLTGLCCTNPHRSNNNELTQALDTLYVSDGIIALGKLKQGLFDGSIEVYRNGDLLLHQMWDNGEIRTNDFYENGFKRRLVYVSERLDSNSTLSYYTDMADSSFQVMPYDGNIVALYKKYKRLSEVNFITNQPTEFIIQNLPDELVSIGVSGATVKRMNDVYVMHPERGSGDTLRVHFFYRDPSCPTDYLSFEIQ